MTDVLLSPAAISEKLAANGTVVIRVKVIPKSASNAIVGLLADGTLKVRIAATPEKGRANEELIAFLAEDFGIAKSGVTIISGASDQLKLVRLTK